MSDMSTNEHQHSTDSPVYYPSRDFDESCLLLNERASLFDKLLSISKGVIIEDGDLTPEVLVTHFSKFPHINAHVYDLSKRLRLSVNHIFWIVRNEYSCNITGERIWP